MRTECDRLASFWGYGTKEELEDAGADLLIERPGELAEATISIIAPATSN